MPQFLGIINPLLTPGPSAAGDLENPVQGWGRQFDLLANVSAGVPLHLRMPQLMWRGRVSADNRDELRRQLVQCPEASGKSLI